MSCRCCDVSKGIPPLTLFLCLSALVCVCAHVCVCVCVSRGTPLCPCGGDCSTLEPDRMGTLGSWHTHTHISTRPSCDSLTHKVKDKKTQIEVLHTLKQMDWLHHSHPYMCKHKYEWLQKTSSPSPSINVKEGKDWLVLLPTTHCSEASPEDAAQWVTLREHRLRCGSHSVDALQKKCSSVVLRVFL